MVDAHEAAVVFFDHDADACRRRVAARVDHCTIPLGGGARAVAQHSRELQPPGPGEGFARVHIVRSFEEATALAQYYVLG